MSVQLAAEIWSIVRENIPYDDREQLADSLVGVLVDHGYDLDDIRHEFTDDSEIQDAIKFYADEGETEDDDDYLEDQDEDDEDW